MFVGTFLLYSTLSFENNFAPSLIWMQWGECGKRMLDWHWRLVPVFPIQFDINHIHLSFLFKSWTTCLFFLAVYLKKCPVHYCWHFGRKRLPDILSKILIVFPMVYSLTNPIFFGLQVPVQRFKGASSSSEQNVSFLRSFYRSKLPTARFHIPDFKNLNFL